jgi:hypothetical protein
MATIFFFINALETALLTWYLYHAGSSSSEQIILGLSPYRLIMVSLLAILVPVFIAAAVMCIRKESRLNKIINNRLSNEGKTWRLFTVFASIWILTIILFTRDAGTFGNLKNLYIQFQPVLSWLFLLSAQSALVLLFHLSFNFNPMREDPSIAKHHETRFVWLIFFASVIVKLLWATPGAYGPLNGDEMEYFSLASYLNQGNIFLAVDAVHYPPLYPAFLVPTIPFGIYTYDLIKIANVLLSSSIVFPVYLIARQYMDARKSIWVVMAACLLPFHLVFPRRIQSENLYFPLFYWCVYMVLNTPKKRRFQIRWDILAGMCLGMLYLTRYITLATLPAFLLGWLLTSIHSKQANDTQKNHLVLRLGAFIACASLVYAPWVLSGLENGHTFKDMLGLFITASVENPGQLTFNNLIIWVLVYAAYLLLMAAPVLPFLMLSVRQLFSGNMSKKTKDWLIFCVTMSGFYCAAVVRHSWRANYNAEMPMKIMGRYLIFLTPLFLITAFAAMADHQKNNKRPAWHSFISMILLPAALIVAAYLMIIQKSVFPINPNALNELGSVDGYLVTVLNWRFFVIVLPVYVLSFLFTQKQNSKILMGSILTGIAIFYLAGLPVYREQLQVQQDYTIIGKEIANQLVEYDPDSQNRDIQFLLSNDLSSSEKQQIYMSIQVRGFHKLTPYSYNPAKPFSNIDENTFILWENNLPWLSSIEPNEVIDLSQPIYKLVVF